MKLNIKKLQSLIFNKGLSYTEVCKTAGITKTTLSRIINQDITVRGGTAGKLATVLGVTVEELIEQ